MKTFQLEALLDIKEPPGVRTPSVFFFQLRVLIKKKKEMMLIWVLLVGGLLNAVTAQENPTPAGSDTG